ncbi:MAG: shikimate kinase [Ferruginibacter sp.]
MGSGKSHWGKIWSVLYQFNFIDLDEEIEKREQQSIADIFEKKGENYFRKKEAQTLRSLQLEENSIISCGGGSPCFYDNINWMNDHGLTVFLNASPNYILDNIKYERDKRPLLKHTNEEELLFFIQQKIKERISFYNKAKIIVEAADLRSDSFIDIKNFQS